MSLCQQPDKDPISQFIDKTNSTIAFPTQSMKKLARFNFERKRHKSVDNSRRSIKKVDQSLSQDYKDETMPLPSKLSPTRVQIFSRSPDSIHLDAANLPKMAKVLNSKDSSLKEDSKDNPSKPRKSLLNPRFIIKGRGSEEKNRMKAPKVKISVFSKSFLNK